MAGPLNGLTIIELASIGPGPFCGMMLADHGARVIRVDRPGVEVDEKDVSLRSRDVVHLDLKKSADIDSLLDEYLFNIFSPTHLHFLMLP